jgi:hypothetical protein
MKHFLTHFTKSTLPKPDKETARKENYTAVLYTKIEVKILKKILTNPTHLYTMTKWILVPECKAGSAFVNQCNPPHQQNKNINDQII